MKKPKPETLEEKFNDLRENVETHIKILTNHVKLRDLEILDLKAEIKELKNAK